MHFLERTPYFQYVKEKTEEKTFLGFRYVVTRYQYGEKRCLITFSDHEWTTHLLPKRSPDTQIVCHLPVLRTEAQNVSLPHLKKSWRSKFKKWGTKILLWLANKQSRYVFSGVSPIHTEKVRERVVTDVLIDGKLSDILLENRLFIFFGLCVIWRNRYLLKKALDAKALHSTSRKNRYKDTVKLLDAQTGSPIRSELDHNLS